MSVNPVFTDGCVKTTDPTKVWDIALGGIPYTSAKGRFGVPGLAVNSFFGQTVARNFPNNPSTLFANFAMQWTALPAGTNLIVQFNDVATVQCGLALLPSGQLQFVRGSSTLLGTPSAAVYPINIINQIAVKAVINSSTGYLECRINGQTTPILTFSGNTQSSANAYATRISFAGGANGLTLYGSDFVLYDNGGSTPNDFIGNKRVTTLVPSADSATAGLNQFSTSPSQSAGNHYLNVVAEPPSGDTAYNFSSTPAQRESYRLTAISGTASGIVGMNISGYMRIDDAGPHTVSLTCRRGNTDVIGTAQNIAASYAYYFLFQATDPVTGLPFNPTDIPNVEVGADIIS